MDKKKDKAQIMSGMEEAVTWDLQNINKIILQETSGSARQSSSIPPRVFLLLLKTLDITKTQKTTLEVSKQQEAA